jgi:hypothetical protein
MYANKIDDLLDMIFIKLYHILKSNKELFISEFSKNNDKINNIISTIISNKEISMIENIVELDENINLVKTIINKYILYYTYNLLGINLDETTFITEIIKINKLNDKNSETNTIIDLFKFIKNIKLYFSKQKVENIENEMKFISNIDEKVINTYLLNHKDSDNNLIKLVILKKIYGPQDRATFLDIINTIQEDNLEYKYIDILLPRTVFVDLNNLQTILKNKKDALDIYELYNEEQTPLTDKEKIDILFKKKYIIPIVDDFLRFNKYIDKGNVLLSEYNSIKQDNTKDDSKIKYIVNQTNKIIDMPVADESNIQDIIITPASPLRLDDYLRPNVNEHDHEQNL